MIQQSKFNKGGVDRHNSFTSLVLYVFVWVIFL